MAKTILVTGATDGLGLLTAKKLAALGHHMLLHGRNPEKLSKAAQQVGGSSELHVADLSDHKSVHRMAEAILLDHSRIDVLINNAGILKTAEAKTETGRDIRFEVNTIAPYLLTRALLPIIPKTGRVVNLSSAAQAPVDANDLKRFRRMADMEAYAQSKLALTIWSLELAHELPNGPVVVAVNPGSLLATKMVQDGFGVSGKDLSIGADILVRAAAGSDFADASGKYYDNDIGRFTEPHPAAADETQVFQVMSALSDIAW